MLGIVGRVVRRKLLYERYEGGFLGDVTATGITYRSEPAGIVEVTAEPAGHATVKFLAAGTASIFASLDYGDGAPPREVGPLPVTVESLVPAKLGPVMIDPDA